MKTEFELISFWLGGKKDYQSGVEIYNRLGKNYALKAMIAKPQTSLRLEMLVKGMQDLLLTVGKQIVPGNTTKEIKAISQEFVLEAYHTGILPSDLPNAPEEVKRVRNKRKNLYAEFIRLHATLNFNTPKEERRVNCLRILEIRKEIKPLWVYTTFYDVNLKLPDEEDSINELSDIDKIRLFEANYKYLRKFYQDEKKVIECERRIKECDELKQILQKNATFFHERLVFPTLTNRGSNL